MAERKSIYDLTPEQRTKGLALSFEKNDLVTRSPFDPAIWFVSSSTTEGHWYTVNTTHTTCECRGFAGHGYCRHLLRVSYEIAQARKKGTTRAAVALAA